MPFSTLRLGERLENAKYFIKPTSTLIVNLRRFLINELYIPILRYFIKWINLCWISFENISDKQAALVQCLSNWVLLILPPRMLLDLVEFQTNTFGEIWERCSLG